MSREVVIPPGEALGVFGGGQLGRMFAVAAARLGYRVHVFAPDLDAPAADVAWRHTRAAYEDLHAVARFAQSVAGVSYEMENIPVAAAEEAARHAVVAPGPRILELMQHRAREKRFLDGRGLPVVPFAIVHSAGEAEHAAGEVGVPMVLKSARGGYDGKGQRKVEEAAEAGRAWSELGVSEAVAETWVDYEAELSVIVARGGAGAAAIYGPMRNEHRRHILDHSVYPAGLGERVEREARELASAAAEALGLIGVCCVEMFLTREGRLLINEVAPRPHNSGHLTIEGFAVSQFEQQVRALCGLPLAEAAARGPAAAMANLLGDLWPAGGKPDWRPVMARPRVSLHLYGKAEARPGRKMGHLTATADSPEEALALALAARAEVEGLKSKV